MNMMEKIEEMMIEIDKEVKDLENKRNETTNNETNNEINNETNNNISSKLNSDEILFIIKVVLFFGVVIFALIMISKARKV